MAVVCGGHVEVVWWSCGGHVEVVWWCRALYSHVLHSEECGRATAGDIFIQTRGDQVDGICILDLIMFVLLCVIASCLIKEDREDILRQQKEQLTRLD